MTYNEEFPSMKDTELQGELVMRGQVNPYPVVAKLEVLKHCLDIGLLLENIKKDSGLNIEVAKAIAEKKKIAYNRGQEDIKQLVRNARKFERGELLKFVNNSISEGKFDIDKLKEIFDNYDEELNLK